MVQLAMQQNQNYPCHMHLFYEKGAINRMASPLVIQYNNQESKISLDTSKFITNRLEAIIDTKEKSGS